MKKKSVGVWERPALVEVVELNHIFSFPKKIMTYRGFSYWASLENDVPVNARRTTNSFPNKTQPFSTSGKTNKIIQTVSRNTFQMVCLHLQYVATGLVRKRCNLLPTKMETMSLGLRGRGRNGVKDAKTVGWTHPVRNIYIV